MRIVSARIRTASTSTPSIGRRSFDCETIAQSCVVVSAAFGLGRRGLHYRLNPRRRFPTTMPDSPPSSVPIRPNRSKSSKCQDCCRSPDSSSHRMKPSRSQNPAIHANVLRRRTQLPACSRPANGYINAVQVYPFAPGGALSGLRRAGAGDRRCPTGRRTARWHRPGRGRRHRPSRTRAAARRGGSPAADRRSPRTHCGSAAPQTASRREPIRSPDLRK